MWQPADTVFPYVLITHSQGICPVLVSDCHRIILVRCCYLSLPIQDSLSSKAVNHVILTIVHGFLSPKETFRFSTCFLCLVSLFVSSVFLSFFLLPFLFSPFPLYFLFLFFCVFVRLFISRSMGSLFHGLFFTRTY